LSTNFTGSLTLTETDENQALKFTACVVNGSTVIENKITLVNLGGFFADLSKEAQGVYQFVPAGPASLS